MEQTGQPNQRFQAGLGVRRFDVTDKGLRTFYLLGNLGLGHVAAFAKLPHPLSQLFVVNMPFYLRHLPFVSIIPKGGKNRNVDLLLIDFII